MPALVRHYLSLSPHERCLRFGAAKSDEAITRYCDAIDWEQARVIGCFVRRQLRGLIELSAPLASRTPAREGAIVVAAGWRRRGIGRRLMQIAAGIARSESCDHVLFYWQAGNDGFARFLVACGGAVEPEGGSGWLDLSRPRCKDRMQQGAPGDSMLAARHA
jgi:GNAT superfamily N-acetyltransferase